MHLQYSMLRNILVLTTNLVGKIMQSLVFVRLIPSSTDLQIPQGLLYTALVWGSKRHPQIFWAMISPCPVVSSDSHYKNGNTLTDDTMFKSFLLLIFKVQMEQNSFGTGDGFYSTTFLYIGIPWLCLAFAVTPQHVLIQFYPSFSEEELCISPYIY